VRALQQTWPVDSDEILLLVERLGAQAIAARDHETGEIHCPDYASGHSVGGHKTRAIEQLEHIKIAHGIDISSIELLTGNERIKAVLETHGRQHGPQQNRYLSKGGFPHRHVPEDRSIL
jgi:hypothetical protein